ncbi:MAG TPA: stage V sporulation protein AB [Candidatus Mediterraneibacter caccogallinarum]|nr:stage V sporulation protein AB [Candidatus Mediterraneibacter caccogallinarum]
MWASQVLLAVIGISAGMAVAAGLFSFIVELGVIADFADRTHTGEKILFYEDCVALGGIVGNIIYVFRIGIPLGTALLTVFGLFAGIFVGCWAMALAEILNVFPVFMRRARIVRYLTAFVISMALGKGIGACLFFFRGW